MREKDQIRLGNLAAKESDEFEQELRKLAEEYGRHLMINSEEEVRNFVQEVDKLMEDHGINNDEIENILSLYR